jgi:predicted nuclease with TOPRIM domain
MPERAFFLQLLRANCSILFQDQAPIDVVTIAPYRILVLSGTTGKVLMSWNGSGHDDFAKFVTETEVRLRKHLEGGGYKGRSQVDSLEELKRRNNELVERMAKMRVSELERQNAELRGEKEGWVSELGKLRGEVATVLEEFKKRGDTMDKVVDTVSEKVQSYVGTISYNNWESLEARVRELETWMGDHTCSTADDTPETWSEVGSSRWG